LRGLLSQPTRLVLVTFPQNPTGFMPDAAYLDRFLEIVGGSDAILVSDEIYAGLPAGSPAPNLADRLARAISLHGLSKTRGLPGLRFGWMATADPELKDRLRQAKNLFNAYVPVPVAILAGIAFDHEAALIARADAIRAACLDAANRFFARHGNLFDWTPPGAGVLSFPRWTGPGGARDLSDRLVAEASISLAPSTCFDAGDGNFRLGLTRRAVPEGLDRLSEYLETRL